MTQLNLFDELIDIKKEKYSAILEEIICDKKNEKIESSFHFIKYNDCINREDDFLKILRNQIISFCFPKKRYKNKDHDEYVSLTYEAKKMFFKPRSSDGTIDTNKTGELGEMALYFLLESYLRAHQIISKMSLKTTGNYNVHGSDGVHVGIHNNNYLSKNQCIEWVQSNYLKHKKNLSQIFQDDLESNIFI